VVLQSAVRACRDLKFKRILKSWNNRSDKYRKGFQGKRESVMTFRRIKLHPRGMRQGEV
jgi:hypothetical protein